MIKYFANSHGEKGLAEIPVPQKDCWIHLESPTAEEMAEVCALTAIPDYFLRPALDEEEAAHLDSEDNIKMVVIDIPKMSAQDDTSEISTIPLGLITSESYFVTVCTKATTVLNDFFEGKIKNINVAQKSKLTYQIIYNSSIRFLYYLKQIDKASDRIQRNLAKSMQNKELLELLGLQKSLVFFSASLSANFAVIQKIANTVNKSGNESDKENIDILEEVIIENKQALEMCSIYREIIKSTMDAFASVVNNNQNLVMKLLTAITIILSIPMIIAGFWGMNTGVPFETKQWGFWAAIGISVLFSAVVWVFMARKKML